MSDIVDNKCPKCGTELVRKPGMFYWRGTMYHGLVCEPCNALWDDPTDSFMAGVARSAREA